MKIDIQTAITNCKTKKVLHLNNLDINDRDILGIVRAIKTRLPNLHTLDLDSNNLTDTGAAVLGEELSNLHDLKELSIQFNNIGREGARAIFSLKREHSDLTILFHGNKITDVAEMARIEQEASGSSMRI